MAAPVAQFDEDWQDFNEFKSASDEALDRINCNRVTEPEQPPQQQQQPRPEWDLWPEFEGSVCGETRSFGSVEELLQNFHQRLGVCFTENSRSVENITEPIEAITEEKLLQQDE